MGIMNWALEQEAARAPKKAIPWLFHITLDGSLPDTLTPRRPTGSDDKAQGILREFREPRVSFAPSVFHCLQAIIPSVYEKLFSEEGQKNGVDFFVYRMRPSQRVRIKTPTELTHERLVWDAHVTHEYCVLDPVKIMSCGKINAWVDKRDPGLTIYPYNDRSLKPEKNRLCEDAKFRLVSEGCDKADRGQGIVFFSQREETVAVESRPEYLNW